MKPHPGTSPSERRGRSFPHDLPVRVVPASKVEQVRIEGDGVIRATCLETSEDLARIGLDPSLASYVVMVMRPGACYFSTYLEYTFYPPGEPALNDLFQLRHVTWDAVLFIVCTIPVDDRPKAEQAANRAELRIADGLPCIITAEGAAFFPLQGPTTFNLESLPGAACYRGETSAKLARAIEEEECREIEAEYKRAYLARRRPT